jgi:general secretion pathway protein C
MIMQGVFRLHTATILALFQKFHRQLCLLLLVIFGLACGQLAATLVGTFLYLDISQESTSQPVSRTASTQISNSDVSRILQQNVFDPAARGRRSPVLKPSRVDNSVKTSPRENLTLVGTLVAGTESTALIEVGKKIKLFHLGDPLPDGSSIEEIQRNRVSIRNQDNSTTDLTLRKETLNKRRTIESSATGSGVRSAGENRWTISRATADTARTNIADQLRLAQMEPRIVNGHTDGFLVRKLSRNSLLTQMGIKRGDVILRVNNMSLDSPEKALQILQQLREARQLTVDLERNKEPMTFAYEIN